MDKLHSTDEALIKGAQTGEGLIPVTPAMLASVGKRVDEENDRLAKIEETVAAIPYEQRLAVTAWVIKHIWEHATDGGSFRYLIYDRLDFGADAYVPLYLAGGMNISNEFIVSTPLPEEDIEAADVIERAYKPLPGGSPERIALIHARVRLLALAEIATGFSEREQRLKAELAELAIDAALAKEGA